MLGRTAVATRAQADCSTKDWARLDIRPAPPGGGVAAIVLVMWYVARGCVE